jgi:hypothetical protein
VVIQEEEQINNQPDEQKDSHVQEEISPQPSKVPQKTNPPPYPERLLVKKPKVPIGHDLEV